MVARTAFANTALGTHTFSTSACPEPARAGTECVYWRGRVGPFGPPLGLELTNLLQIVSAKTKGALCRIFSAFVTLLIVLVSTQRPHLLSPFLQSGFGSRFGGSRVASRS